MARKKKKATPSKKTAKPVKKTKKSPSTGKNSKNKNVAKTTVKQKTLPKKEKITLLQRLISVLKKQLKALKRKNSPVRNEYRYNIKEDHMNYVFEINKGEWKAVGFTHEETTFGKRNMPLQKNPKKGDTEKSFVRNGVIETDKHSYSKKTAKNYQLTGEDLSNTKSKIRNYKKERKIKKAQEKKAKKN